MDPDSGPSVFIIDLQDANKKLIKKKFCILIFVEERIYYVNIFIRNMCLANYGTSEAVYPCNVEEKIHEYFRSKMRQCLRE